MARFVYAVLLNAVEGREAELNEWAHKQHLPDILRVPGFKTAQRFEATSEQRRPSVPPHKYLHFYTLETENLAQSLHILGETSGTSQMPRTDAVAPGAVSWMFRPITPLLFRKE